MKSLIVAALLAFAAPALAGAFWQGTVVGVASNDVLKIRKWPGTSSKIIAVVPPGGALSLAGRCEDIKTNRSFQIDGPETTAQKHAQMKKANVWCQVMTPSAGLGWARGTFVWPQ
jgi:hypothetical protein